MIKRTIFYISLLISISTYSLGAEQFEAVRDVNGDILRSGVDYYILPVLRGRGGGVTLASTRNETCPLDVVQESFELENGLPVVFTPINPKKGVIRESTDLNIKFSSSNICVQSTVWKRESYEGEVIVTTGGVEGNPGRQTLGSWFMIEKFDNDYKIAFCPQVCIGIEACPKPLCGDIGISFKNDARRLVFSDVPFKVQFKKA